MDCSAFARTATLSMQESGQNLRNARFRCRLVCRGVGISEMMRFVKGNLLDAKVDALVNTVNTVGVMGKGIALMFKEAFPENYAAYEKACKRDEVQLGHMFVTERDQFLGPKWIINFPTKKH